LLCEFACVHSATVLSQTGPSLQGRFGLFIILLLVAQLVVFVLGALLSRGLGRRVYRVLTGIACLVAVAGLVCVFALGVMTGVPFGAGGGADAVQGAGAAQSADAVQGAGALDAQQAGTPPPAALLALLGAAAVCMGLGLAAFNLAWARVFSVLGSRELYRQVIFSYLLGLVLYLLLSFLPAAAVVPLVIAALTGSAILLSLSPVAAEETPGEADAGEATAQAAGAAVKASAAKTASGTAGASAAQAASGTAEAEARRKGPLRTATKRVVRLLWRPVLCTAAFSFMSGLMSEVSAQGRLPLESFQQASILASLIVVGILLLPALLLSKPLDITGAYRIALPISAAGFMLLPFVWDTLFGLTNVLMNMGLMTVSIILWCMLATTTRQTRLSARVVFGACLALVIGARLLGKVLGLVYESHLTQSFLSLTAVALISIYLLSMVSLVLFKGQRLARGHEAEDEGLRVVVWGEDRYRECCGQIAQAADFTPRETEVFLLLGQGRSIANISGSLFVSENTAKSHIRSIYRKLGVHSKQELIDLVSASLGTGQV
jgi:DNA-binding CsgD family transcriptional regulator/MFS family permease